MKYLDLTLPTPEANLALDEALLDLCDGGGGDEILRFWEPSEPFVVVGYANEAAREADLDACQAGGVRVLRRCSGGGTVLQGPGCLNYSVLLQIPESGPLQGITGTNHYVLQRHQAALEPLLKAPVEIQGHTDLAVRNLKFSGNAQRRKRKCLIFHGTFLLGFDLASVEKFLRMPSRQPDYRRNRAHADFLTNLNLPPEALKAALRKAWCAAEPLKTWPERETADLVMTKYATREWNFKI